MENVEKENTRARKIINILYEKIMFFLSKDNYKVLFYKFVILIFVINMLSILTLLAILPDAQLTEDQQSLDESSKDTSEIEADCNVYGISINGSIDTYQRGASDYLSEEDVTTSDSVLASIRQANSDDRISAIMVEVDSYGGIPVAAEEIATAIGESEKPVYARIRQHGLSAAYWAISTADRIFASQNSDVGSIGVTSSYLDQVKQNTGNGLEYVNLSSGKFKDAGTPNKPLTEEERDLFMRDIKITHENFIKAVSDNRNIDIDKVRGFSDGSSVLGAKALELGLIDEIGLDSKIIKYIGDKIGKDAKVCW